MDKRYNVHGWLEFDGRRISFTNEVTANNPAQAGQKIRETYVQLGAVTEVTPSHIHYHTHEGENHHTHEGEHHHA